MDEKNLADLYDLDPIPWTRALEALEIEQGARAHTSWPPPDPTVGRMSRRSAHSGTRARSTS
jgi:hypothetical protein